MKKKTVLQKSLGAIPLDTQTLHEFVMIDGGGGSFSQSVRNKIPEFSTTGCVNCYSPSNTALQTASTTNNYSSVVVDVNGTPLPGANIVVEGSSPLIGTVTNANGMFSINTSSKARIRISYMGFKSQSISVMELPSRITLIEDVIELPGTVVTPENPDTIVSKTSGLKKAGFGLLGLLLLLALVKKPKEVEAKKVTV